MVCAKTDSDAIGIGTFDFFQLNFFRFQCFVLLTTFSGCCFCSEFSDIFDLDHFKKTLAEDLLVVSSLPSTHLMSRPVEEKKTPLHVDAQWIRRRYQKRVKALLLPLSCSTYFMARK